MTRCLLPVQVNQQAMVKWLFQTKRLCKVFVLEKDTEVELGEPSMESNGVLGDVQDADHAWGEWLPDPSKDSFFTGEGSQDSPPNPLLPGNVIVCGKVQQHVKMLCCGVWASGGGGDSTGSDASVLPWKRWQGWDGPSCSSRSNSRWTSCLIQPQVSTFPSRKACPLATGHCPLAIHQETRV